MAPNKRIILFLAILLVAGFFIRYSGAELVARASIFDTFWNNFIAPLRLPFGTESTSPPAPAAPSGERQVPLYQPALDYERAVIEAVKKASPAVVAITVSKNVPIIENCPVDPFFDVPDQFRRFFEDNIQLYRECERGTELQEVGGGSGFVLTPDGLIVTNKHVVLDEKASYTVLTSDGKKYDAKVLARDPVLDLAVVKVDAAGLPTVTLGDSDSIELGQTAIAIGNALSEFTNTVSVGVVSGLARTVTAGTRGFSETIHNVIQTDAAINPGNSGGPLLNLKGEVIGINTAIVSGAQNIGFAIPINRAKRDIESVKETGEIVLPFLGVRYVMITPDFAEANDLSVEDGALLRGTDEGPAVTKDSPAAAAGLKAEDIVLEVNGEKITRDNILVEVVSKYRVGETVTLVVLRGGERMTVPVTLGKRPE